MDELLNIMERLRADGGCPWDREQTLESLKQYTIEECFEVIDAVDSGDPEKHAEELGDLLLQIVFHAQIRSEKGQFAFRDVVNRVCEKLVRRHPHVFSDTRVSGSADVLKNWESIKAAERAGTDANPKNRSSMMDGIPRSVPALQRALQAQKRASRVGFDWTRPDEVLDKIEEELEEIRESLPAGNAEATREEIGDMLFAAVNLCRFQNINAEHALNRATEKFMMRFKAMEQRLAAAGSSVERCGPEELDACWNEVKAMEKLGHSSS